MQMLKQEIYLHILFQYCEFKVIYRVCSLNHALAYSHVRSP